MKNEEKYKTTEERLEAFKKQEPLAAYSMIFTGAMVMLKWLKKDVKEKVEEKTEEKKS